MAIKWISISKFALKRLARILFIDLNFRCAISKNPGKEELGMALLVRVRLCICVALLSCILADGEQHGSALHDSKVTKDKE